MNSLLDIFIDAKEYGSILTVEEYDWELLESFVADSEPTGQISMETVGIEDTKEALLQIIAQGKVLAQKYWVAVTNLPYMGGAGMSDKLACYLSKLFPRSKTDLYSTFIERCTYIIEKNGYSAMITQHGWMFLSSFEKLRTKLEESDIICMAHLGARAFDEISGEVVQTTTFITRNSCLADYKGVYSRLLSATSESEKEKLYLSGKYQYKSGRKYFDIIPGKLVAYWFNEKFLKVFEHKNLSDVAKPRQGLATGDNERFLRLWSEVGINKIKFDCKSRDDATKIGKKWFPCNKGGSYRKWYGNNDYIVNWENDGVEIKNNYDKNGKLKSRPQNMDFYFNEGMTWSTIASSNLAMRYSPVGHIFETKGSVCFPNNQSELFYLLALTNTPIVSVILSVLSPTLDFHEGSLGKVPTIIKYNYMEKVSNLVKESIHVSKSDWDSYETSWDFKYHPIVKNVICNTAITADPRTISDSYHSWVSECEQCFMGLKANEEELNRIFIDIYGLQN